MGGFLPAGYPYNTMPFGQFGTGQSAAAPAHPNPSTMTPQEVMDWYTTLANTPQGQAAAAAQQQTIAMNVKQALAAMQNERDRIAIAQGQAAADKWYKEESLKLAQQAHQLAVQTQTQNYELSGAALTGTFQGNPTLANQAQTAMYTGLYGGTPTLQAINQEQQFGLQQGGLTGMYNGAPTLAAQNQAQQYGLQLGAQTGYQGGQATLGREQAAASAAMEAARLGASLQGPANYAKYLQAANAVAGSPVSALVASAPGGMGQMQGDPGGPMTLATMLGQYGVMPGQGPSQPGQSTMHGPSGQAFTDPYGASQYAMQQPEPGGGQMRPSYLDPRQYAQYDALPPEVKAQYMANDPGAQMHAGGTPGFNEQTGSYSSAPAGGMRPSGGSGGMAFTDGGRGTNPVGGGQQSARVPVESGNRSTMPVGPTDPNRTRQPVQAQPMPVQQQGWNPQSVTGAIGQVASAPRVTNAQLGLTDQEAGQLQSWMSSPNQASGTWWASKSGSQKEYLKGLGSYWGHDMNTFEERERNARPRQAAWNAAV